MTKVEGSITAVQMAERYQSTAKWQCPGAILMRHAPVRKTEQLRAHSGVTQPIYFRVHRTMDLECLDEHEADANATFWTPCEQPWPLSS